MTSTINVSIISLIISHYGINAADLQLGLSHSHESYQDTADRLRDAGDNDNADLYEALETRWYEIEDGVA